jgi:arylsulfatase A-like enzyme
MEGPLDDSDVRQVRALFDGALAATDVAIGHLIDGLAHRAMLKDTVIVLTADHGECLFEQGRGQGHGDHLFGDETTRVPLIMIDPRRTMPPEVKELVRDVDLAPTLYELAGVDAPSDLDGRSLAARLSGRPWPSVYAFAETGLWFTREIPGLLPAERLPYGDLTELLQVDPKHADEMVVRPELDLLTIAAKHRMVRDERFKLVYLPMRTGAAYKLFDTQNDPAELEDVSAKFPPELARLKDELWRWMLEDRRMEQRGDLLLPKPVSLRRSKVQDPGLRAEEASP